MKTQNEYPENSEVGKLQALINKHEKIQHCHSCGGDFDRVTHVVEHYEQSAVRAILSAKEFRDRMIIDLRAMSLVLSSVGNAQTHREKSPRLRGAIELLESAIKRLEQESFDIATCSRFAGFDDVFRSDYPSRHFVERIRQLEQELAEAKNPTAPPTE